MENNPEIKQPEETLPDVKLPIFLGEQACKDWWVETECGDMLRFGEAMLEDF